MRAPLASRYSLAGLLLVAACGGGTTGPDDDNNDNDDDNNNGTPSSVLSATIDGQAWSSPAGSATAIQFAPQSGGYIITGIGTGVVASMTFTINLITRAGTYPLGVDGVSVQGGFAGVTGGGTWLTPISGAAGTITITTLTTTRIAGTFSYSAIPSGGGATGTRTVTNGQFDLPISGNAPIAVLTDSMGSKMSASLSGQAWNAGIVSGQTTATHLSLSGINNLQTLILTIPRPTAAGAYQLSNQPGSILMAWDPNAVAPAGARCCYGILGDVGTLTITSLTTTRIKGTFTASLRPQPGTAATGTLTISSGTFDIGLFHTP
jgi:hypothetical protein